MEGGHRGGFHCDGFPNFPNSQTYHLDPPPLYASPPLLTPQNSFALNRSHQKYDNNQGMSNAFSEVSFFDGGIGSSFEQGRVSVIRSLPINQSSGVNNKFLNEGQLISTWAQVQNCPNYQIIDFSNNHVTNPRKGDSKGGRNTTKKYTKGTWTKIEDNKLLDLVEELGTKNWAIVSEFMEGRAGKQCRERWFNYLRPDIKTDDWSEDEERILIKAHEELGNRWSEITKRIPGRTENGIKNHWYAAQRKKTMRINSKKNESNSGKPKSTVLRDYIMSRASGNTTPPTNLPENVTKGNLTACNSSDSLPKNVENFFQMPLYDDDPPVDLVPSYDEESSFMQKLFGSTHPLPDMDPQLELNGNPSSQHGSSSSSIPQTNADQLLSTDDYILDGTTVLEYDGDINRESALNVEGEGGVSPDASVFRAF